MLVKNGFVLPPYAYYDTRFEGMYAEEIYDVLENEMRTDDMLDDTETATEENNSESSGEMWEEQQVSLSEVSPGESVAEEEILSQEELEELFEQIFQKHKRQGNLPEDLALLIPEYFSHKADWREILYRYIASYAKSTYSFVPPNMKYLYRGIYLPSLSSDLLRIVIAVDTSGSVDKELLGTFLGEVSAIMQRYPNYEIDLITADAKIQSHQVFLPGEALEYEVGGGGGTDFRPVFEYINNYINYPTLLLYFTDGQGIFPQNEPEYDLLWVMTKAQAVPFGEVLVLEGNH